MKRKFILEHLDQFFFRARSIVAWCYSWNIDVLLMYVVVSVVYIQKITHWHLHFWLFLTIALANVFGVFGVYMLNRLTDDEEDIVNERRTSKSSSWYGYSASFLFLAVACLLYGVVGGAGQLWLYGLILASLGTLYSFPKKYRLKSLPLIKNIVPAFCWTLSLAVLIAVGGSERTPFQIFLDISPLFFLAFAFEIFWDIPDVRGDSAARVRTLPVLIGVSATKWMLVLFLAAIFFLVDSLPAQVCALFLVSVLLLVSRHTKTIYHLVLTLFVFVVIVVNMMIVQYGQVSQQGDIFTKMVLADTTVFEYEYGEWSGLQEKPELETKIFLRPINDGRYAYERENDTQKSIVFDTETLTITEKWQKVPFRYLPTTQSVQGNLESGQERRGSYRVSPREGSICHEDVEGDFLTTTLPPARSAFFLNGEKKVGAMVMGIQTGSWKHCETVGKVRFSFQYLPGSNLLTSFEGTVYYGEVPERTIRMRLKNIVAY